MLRAYDSGGYCVGLCYVVVVMMYYFHSVGGVCWVFKVLWDTVSRVWVLSFDLIVGLP